MMKLLVIIVLTGLLSPEAESFTISEKEYDNIDKILDFGVKIFLNYLDKVKQATEQMVKDDMLRTNRIAIQNYWTSFQETTKKIRIEEKSKGVKDDLVIAARIVRRLFMHYKDDVLNVFSQVGTKKHIQKYLPITNIFKGVIEKGKVDELFGTVVANYYPEAPPIKNGVFELLCYIMSTHKVELFALDFFKLSTEVISKLQETDFEEISQSVRSVLIAINKKINEITSLEKEKEKDSFILSASVASRVIVYYWERFLEFTDTPVLKAQYETISSQLNEDQTLATLQEMIEPVIERERLKELFDLHTEFFREFYMTALSASQFLFFIGDEDRSLRTVRTVGMGTVVNIYPIYERMLESGVLSNMKSAYFRALNIIMALAGEEEFQTFREEAVDNLISLLKKANILANEERPHSQYPQVLATARLFSKISDEFVDKINSKIDDNTVRSLAENWKDSRTICIKKALESGQLTEEQLTEIEAKMLDSLLQLGKTAETIKNKERLHETYKAILKVGVVGIYAPLIEMWNSVSA